VHRDNVDGGAAMLAEGQLLRGACGLRGGDTGPVRACGFGLPGCTATLAKLLSLRSFRPSNGTPSEAQLWETRNAGTEGRVGLGGEIRPA